MKKLHFNCLIVISVLFFGTVNGFAQQTYTRGAFNEIYSKDPVKYQKYKQESNKKNEEWLAKQAKKKKKRPCYTYQQMFDSLRLNRGEEAAAFAERRFIEKGDSVRIKFVFNNRIVEHISVEG